MEAKTPGDALVISSLSSSGNTAPISVKITGDLVFGSKR